jgi:uncharacterized phiE125 gp8 family phage protein
MGQVMIIETLEPPTDRIVSLAEMKAHLRVDHTDDDSLIDVYTIAAEQRVDGPFGITGRAFRPQRLRASFGSFGAKICLPFPPLISVDSIAYLDTNGVEQTFAETGNWRVIGAGTERGAEIVPLYGVVWPSLLSTSDADLVRVAFTAGYYSAASPENDRVPEIVKACVKLIVGDWYEHRPSSVIGATAAPTPFGAENLIAPFRVPGAYMALDDAGGGYGSGQVTIDSSAGWGCGTGC